MNGIIITCEEQNISWQNPLNPIRRLSPECKFEVGFRGISKEHGGHTNCCSRLQDGQHLESSQLLFFKHDIMPIGSSHQRNRFAHKFIHRIHFKQNQIFVRECNRICELTLHYNAE